MDDDTREVERELDALDRDLHLSLAEDGETWRAAAPGRGADVGTAPWATGSTRLAAAEAVLAEVRRLSN